MANIPGLTIISKEDLLRGPRPLEVEDHRPFVDDPTITVGPLHVMLQGQLYSNYSNEDVGRELGEGLLRVNDLIFNVGPTAIQVDGHDINYDWETLRTKTSMKARSGRGTVSISINLIFTRDSRQGWDELTVINNTLIPLVKEFRKTPFCELENEMLRRVLPVAEHQPIAAALISMSASTVGGFPGSISVQLNLSWFNYKPFSPDFAYRREWVTESVTKEQAKYKKLGDLDYRVFRGNPARIFNSTAVKPTTDFIRSAPAMLHFRDDLIKVGPDGIAKDRFDILPTAPRDVTQLDDSVGFKFWQVKIPSSPPPSVVEGVSSYKDYSFGGEGKESSPAEILAGAASREGYIVPFKSKGRNFRTSGGTLASFKEMQKAAKKDGVELWVVSAWRSQETQTRLWKNFLRDNADVSWQEAREWQAPPRGMRMPDGSIAPGSKHQDATALDIRWNDASTTDRPKGKRGSTFVYWKNAKKCAHDKGAEWLRKNAPKFNFKPWASEPWHWNYIGPEVATPKKGSNEAKSPETFKQIVEIADTHGVPRSLALALVSTSSEFNEGNVGRSGGIGLLSLTTERSRLTVEDLENPEQNLNFGFGDLAANAQEFGNWKDALLAHWLGAPEVRRLKSSGEEPPIEIEANLKKVVSKVQLDYEDATLATHIDKRYVVQEKPRTAAAKRRKIVSGQDRKSLLEKRDRVLRDLFSAGKDIGLGVEGDERADVMGDLSELRKANALMMKTPGLKPKDVATIEGHTAESIDDDIRQAGLVLNDHWIQKEAPESEGWILTRDRVTKKLIFKRPIFYDIAAKSDVAVVSFLQFALAHTIAPMPVVGWRYPTFQYLGSVSPRVTLGLIYKGEEGRVQLRELLSLIHQYAKYSITLREFHKTLGISVENDLLNAVGISNLMLEDWKVETMPDAKDCLSITLNFVDNSIELSDEFSIPMMNRRTELANELISTILEKSQMTAKRIEVSREEIRKDLERSRQGVRHGRGSHIEFKVEKKTGDRALDDLALGLARRFTRYGEEIEHYPEIYRLGSHFSNPRYMRGDPWKVSNGDKNKKILNGETGRLRRFLSEMDVWIEHVLIPAIQESFDPDVREALNRFNISGSLDALPCYPDLDLPPNPITGKVVDMNPDFYFFNKSDKEHGNPRDGNGGAFENIEDYKKRGEKALRNSFNFFTKEQVGDESESLLRSRKYQDKRFETNDPASFKEEWLQTKSSNKGESSSDYEAGGQDNPGFDLYEEVPDEAKIPDARDSLQHDASENGMIKEFNDYVEKEFVEDKLTMRRAYPTFKVFFIEEDQPNKPWKVFDDFYGLNSIKEIRIVRSRKVAADLCMLQVTNVAGTLNNRKFPEFKAELLEKLGINPDDKQFLTGKRAKETVKDQDKTVENPFDSTILKEGTKIQVRLGYDNNYENLETVFNGQIVGIEGNELLTIICQSYATELVAIEKGNDPADDNFGFLSADTDQLLSYLIAQPEAKHFGRWRLSDIGGLPLHTTLNPDGGGHLRWGFVDTPADDNIFPEPWSNMEKSWHQFIVEYTMYHTTIWDVFKEMELRHPGWIASPVPYDDRMTMFFGLPCMKYFYRGPKTTDEIRRAKLFKEGVVEEVARAMIKGGHGTGGSLSTGAKRYSPKEFGHLRDAIADHAEAWRHVLKRDPENELAQRALAASQALRGFSEESETPGRRKLLQEAERELAGGGKLSIGDATMGFMTKSFRDYHFVTSEHDIIQNNIIADHRGTYNTVSIAYNDNIITTQNPVDERPDGGTLTIAVDDHIPKHHLRHTHIPEPNCQGYYFAARYGIGHLMRSLKDTYKGSLTVLGMPKVKPYDVVFLLDSYTDMAGPIEVEAVIHTMSKETGFITEIIPDLCITARRGAMVSMIDGMQQVVSKTHGWLVQQYGNDGANVASAMGAGGVGIGVYIGKGAVGALGTKAALAAASAPGLTTAGSGGLTGALALGTGKISAGAIAGSTTIGAVAASLLPAAIVGVSLLLVAAGGMKLLNAATVREPIFVTPLIRSGKPYISGFDGFARDGFVTAIMGQWKHWMNNVSEGVNVMGSYLDNIEVYWFGDT